MFRLSPEEFAQLLSDLEQDKKEYLDLWRYFPAVSLDAKFTNELAEKLGRSLRGNKKLTFLNIPLQDLTSLNAVKGIAHFLSAPSSNMQRLVVHGSKPLNHRLLHGTQDTRDETTLAAIMDQVLLAAGFSENLRDLSISGAFGAHALAHCLIGCRASLVELELRSIMTRDNQFLALDATLVAKGIRSLDSLQELSIRNVWHNGPNSFFAAIMSSLAEKGGLPAQVRKLDIGVDQPVGAGRLSKAIQDILLSTAVLEEFKMDASMDDAARDMVLSGLYLHPSVRTVELSFFSNPMGLVRGEICAKCYKPESSEQGHSLLACSRCKRIKYCSKDCQKQHWVLHKKHCSTDSPPPPPPPPPPQQRPPAAYAAIAHLDPNLVQQVMSLTPQQIQQLPPDAQQNLLTLRQQIQGSM